MASVFKPKGSNVYHINWTDERGKRRKKVAFSDKRESQRLADRFEENARKIRIGLVDPSEVAVTSQAQLPIGQHVDRFHDYLIEQNKTGKFADLARRRLTKIFAMAKVRHLRDIRLENIQTSLADLRDQGRGLKTLNHYGDTCKFFLEWCRKTGRILRNPLKDLERYNAKTDLRHERRAISLEEFARLLHVARNGNSYGKMTGLVRELCYKTAVMTGLRFGELKALRAEWINAELLTITIPARFSKNRKQKTLPLEGSLARQLETHLETVEAGDPVFPMPKRGSDMIKKDLALAGIAYRDRDDRVFDFHCLRVMTATLHDEIGTSTGVRRELMRHATESMTAHYTRPRDESETEAVRQLGAALASATESATRTSLEMGQIAVTPAESLGCENIWQCDNAGAIPAASITYVN